MPRRKPRRIDASERLRDSERWPTSIIWPAAIDERLGALVDLAIEDGGEAERMSRAELLAALVLAAPAEGEALSDLLRRFRRAKVADAVVKRPGDPSTKVIMLRDRRPGPRS
ncbi:MAG: hypothetical protein U0414_31755 [Polyangiaceae bacterium]